MKDERRLEENKVHVDDFKQIKEPTPDIVETLSILLILGFSAFVAYMIVKSIYMIVKSVYTLFFVAHYF